MVNSSYINGLAEQPLQREEYKKENELIQINYEKLKKMLDDEGNHLLWELINAQDTILIGITEDCYINGICTATKFLINNIVADID